MRIFKKKSTPLPYDKINKKPVVKASICNGEQVHAERVGHRQGTLFFNYQDPRRVVPCRY